MNDVPTRVAIIGIGWMREYYVEAYSKRPDVEIVAIVESNSERRSAFATRYSVAASYGDAEAMLRDMVPDVVAVITPIKYFKEIVVACVEAGVKGVSVEKPIGGVLSDVDEMVDLCESRGVVFAGGRVQRTIKGGPAGRKRNPRPRIRKDNRGPACITGAAGPRSPAAATSISRS